MKELILVPLSRDFGPGMEGEGGERDLPLARPLLSFFIGKNNDNGGAYPCAPQPGFGPGKEGKIKIFIGKSNDNSGSDYAVGPVFS
jgi:hypothetical protein